MARRISALFKLANVEKIHLMKLDGKPAFDRFGNPETTRPHVRMLRHTFAVGELAKGGPEEVVAKMCGTPART